MSERQHAHKVHQDRERHNPETGTGRGRQPLITVPYAVSDRRSYSVCGGAERSDALEQDRISRLGSDCADMGPRLGSRRSGWCDGCQLKARGAELDLGRRGVPATEARWSGAEAGAPRDGHQ
jgi:hypothetical protein